MSAFSRSLRSPSYLSPRRRPHMPGRTVSGSSERSMASDDGADQLSSGQSTPTHLPYHGRRYGSTLSVTTDNNSGESASANRENSYFAVGSRPISIELPRVNRINTAPVYTPPEPLSARGDLPGGYFPLHEDPNSRVHRPHPFHHEKKSTVPPAVQSEPVIEDQDQKPLRRTATSLNIASQANIPVASYYPTGYSDNSLPMGKYYPSNYERTHKHTKKRPLSTSAAITSGPSVQEGAPDPPAMPSEAETRRRLQQYQRDMMAQVSLAANEIIGSNSRGNKASSKDGALAGFKGLPANSVNLGSSALRPNSPRLDPLGSPGPVTPMELGESSGSYLDKGQGFVPSSGQGHGTSAPGKGYTAHSM